MSETTVTTSLAAGLCVGDWITIPIHPRRSALVRFIARLTRTKLPPTERRFQVTGVFNSSPFQLEGDA